MSLYHDRHGRPYLKAPLTVRRNARLALQLREELAHNVPAPEAWETAWMLFDGWIPIEHLPRIDGYFARQDSDPTGRDDVLHLAHGGEEGRAWVAKLLSWE